MLYKKTKTAVLLRNEINNFVALHLFYSPTSSVRRILKRGEPGTSENLRKGKSRVRNCSSRNQCDFLPKIKWRAKKKRSSLKFCPIFCPKLKITRLKHRLYVLKPSLQLTKGGCRNFAYYYMLNILYWRPNAPPPLKYAPVSDHRLFISRLETDTGEEHWRKNNCSCCEVFLRSRVCKCFDWTIWNIFAARMNRDGKSHAADIFTA